MKLYNFISNWGNVDLNNIEILFYFYYVVKFEKNLLILSIDEEVGF